MQGKIGKPKLNNPVEKMEVKKKKKTFYQPFIIKPRPWTGSSDLMGIPNIVKSSTGGSWRVEDWRCLWTWCRFTGGEAVGRGEFSIKYCRGKIRKWKMNVFMLCCSHINPQNCSARHRKYSRQLGEPSHAKDQLQSIYLCGNALMSSGYWCPLSSAGMSKACET